MTSSKLPCRSFLYVPGDQEDRLRRAGTRGADAVIIDLEDGVSPGAKDKAVRLAAEQLQRTTGEAGPEWWVRVNGGRAGMSDLRTLLNVASVHGVWLPKAEPGSWVDDALGLIAAEPGVRVGLLIESAAGLRNIADLPALPDGTLLQIGEVDLSASLGMRDRSSDAMHAFRMQIVLESAARGLPSPVAPVSTVLDHLDEFESETVTLKERGFGSRACVHPRQVERVNRAFTVSDRELDEARALLREFDEHEAAGQGAYSTSDGAMADIATVRNARSIVASSRFAIDIETLE